MPRGRHVSPKAEDRFWSKVDTAGFCWWWQGCKVPSGYGTFYYNGARHYAHRIAYELTKGFIPEGLVIDHLCREPSCVNPSHLEVVTHRENVLRGDVPRQRKNEWMSISLREEIPEIMPDDSYEIIPTYLKWHRYNID